MKRTLEPLRFDKPVRDVRLRGLSASAPTPWREVEEQAYERGRREGERALSEQLIQQRSDLRRLEQGVLSSLQEVLPKLTRECENALVALAFQSAQKVIAGVPISAELVEATVREALSHVEEATEYTILLNPEDLQLLQRTNSPLCESNEREGRVRLRSAGEVTRGGCIIETRFGTIDGCREAKLEVLKKRLEV